jgi:hypothetical protein
MTTKNEGKNKGNDSNRSSSGMTTRTATATSTAKAGQCWLENPKGWCWVDFFGILHYVQDDGSDLKQQRQVQLLRQQRA